MFMPECVFDPSCKPHSLDGNCASVGWQWLQLSCPCWRPNSGLCRFWFGFRWRWQRQSWLMLLHESCIVSTLCSDFASIIVAGKISASRSHKQESPDNGPCASNLIAALTSSWFRWLIKCPTVWPSPGLKKHISLWEGRLEIWARD